MVSELPSVDFPPFDAHPLLRRASAMTLFGSLARRGLDQLVHDEERRIVLVDDATSVRVGIDRPPDSNPRSALVIMHGLVGSSESFYVLGTARKALDAGFLVARINARNCGGTEDLTSAAYNGGETEDIEAVARDLVS